MSDSVEEGQSLANALETRSVYTRIGIIIIFYFKIYYFNLKENLTLDYVEY